MFGVAEVERTGSAIERFAILELAVCQIVPRQRRERRTVMIDGPPLTRLAVASWECRDFVAECV